MHPRNALALVCLAGSVAAQSSWFSPTLAVNPPPRDTHRLATEPVSGNVLLFGGVLATNAGQLNDTWEWNGQAWSQLSSSVTPVARESFVLVGNGTGGVVLFGGYSFTAGLLNDTWTYAQGQWQSESPASRPTPRRYHAAAYTGTSVLLFGGADAGTSVSYNDTWEWSGGNWTQRSPATVPFTRHAHELTRDTARGRVVMFGGSSGGSLLNDTWEWDGTNWTRALPLVSPPARGGSYMAYHEGIHRTVVYGGGGSSGLLGDCWTWDGSNWTPVVLQSPNPGVRNAPIAFSPLSSALLLFGGHAPGSSRGDTWLTAPNVPATFTTFGTGCSGAGGIPTLAAISGDVPHLGQSFDMQIANLPIVATVVVGVLGFSTTMNNGPLGTYPLPASLSGLGMIGCTQYVSDDATFFMLSLSSTLNWSIAIPANAGLVGLTFNVQGAVFDPAANPFGVTATNGGTAQIGT